jgi:hypothetical protein
MGFIIGGFIFFITALYFIILAIWPEWVGVSGRDHQQTLADQKEQELSASSSQDEKSHKN